eukprot:CAMPEP_0177619060 /NCGR_PEP_ID=MMETSP0419_2-20121207/26020_1 /TAXON_ID=582737 /ORGANISM="Tetraselmis sp., Strain GSL018" /LENGTH=46 /DNA_ID= /DNA_START= /DNA_END= /DNA_ORIENTATION=
MREESGIASPVGNPRSSECAAPRESSAGASVYLLLEILNLHVREGQ